MGIKKNENNIETTAVPKVNRSLLKAEEKKCGRKALEDENLKADKRNTFLLNAYQQESMEKRMEELKIRNKTDYILYLLKNDIKEL